MGTPCAAVVAKTWLEIYTCRNRRSGSVSPYAASARSKASAGRGSCPAASPCPCLLNTRGPLWRHSIPARTAEPLPAVRDRHEVKLASGRLGRARTRRRWRPLEPSSTTTTRHRRRQVRRARPALRASRLGTAMEVAGTAHRGQTDARLLVVRGQHDRQERAACGESRARVASVTGLVGDRDALHRCGARPAPPDRTCASRRDHEPDRHRTPHQRRHPDRRDPATAIAAATHGRLGRRVIASASPSGSSATG